MIAVSTIDTIGGLVLGTIGGVALIVDGLLDARRAKRKGGAK